MKRVDQRQGVDEERKPCFDIVGVTGSIPVAPTIFFPWNQRLGKADAVAVNRTSTPQQFLGSVPRRMTPPSR